MAGGAEAMPDYELLELVLLRASAKDEIGPLANALLEKFGDFNNVISAKPARLREISGIGSSVIEDLKIVEAAAQRMARGSVMGREVLSSWDSLLSYCTTRMAYLDTEQFRVLFLDRKNVLIADEAQQSGTVDHVPVYPREIVKRALELSASALILVHNHPSGDPTPSQADIDMTNLIRDGASILGVTLHDHLIIGKSDSFSFRSEGLI